MERKQLESEPKPLGKETYAGCVDTVGGNVLANALSMTKYGGCVAACGLAGGMGLPTTVAPFILRGVQLAGIESALVPIEKRPALYEKFGPIMKTQLDLVSDSSRVIGLDAVPGVAQKILNGEVQGRYVVDPNK